MKGSTWLWELPTEFCQHCSWLRYGCSLVTGCWHVAWEAERCSSCSSADHFCLTNVLIFVLFPPAPRSGLVVSVSPCLVLRGEEESNILQDSVAFQTLGNSSWSRCANTAIVWMCTPAPGVTSLSRWFFRPANDNERRFAPPGALVIKKNNTTHKRLRNRKQPSVLLQGESCFFFFSRCIALFFFFCF